MAIKYGHSFPADFGFSGSAGQQQVRGYKRGGMVKDATFDAKRSGGEKVSARGGGPRGTTFDATRSSGESIKPRMKTDTTMPTASSTGKAPVRARQAPVRGTPKGALQQKGPLMPGYARGGKTTPQPFKRGGREEC